MESWSNKPNTMNLYREWVGNLDLSELDDRSIDFGDKERKTT